MRLRALDDGREVSSPARLRIGRASDSGLMIPRAFVSLEHATVRWSGDAWEVRDLGSRNGTFVDGKPITPGQAVVIDVGARLAFGDPDEAWLVVEADPPAILAERDDGAFVAGRDGLLVLPSVDAPDVSIYQDTDGRWRAERDDGTHTPIDDGARITAGGATWTVQLPAIFEGTPALQTSPTLDAISLRFAVSADEEQVRIGVVHRGRVTPLDPAWHGYVLLTLARIRQSARHLPVDERGWVDRDKLLAMLRMDTNSLNVAIHKAREQLLAAGVLGAAGVVEVRRGQRRFGTDHFEILRSP
ncbi:FHA domain-containing protein [Myxococcota bacterium]|nr:FHA domain-containing protein [Myxococcota bacterium]